MNLSGRAMLDGSRGQVWELIFDPEALCHLIPGCESLEKISDDEYRGRMRIGVASVAGIYDLQVKIAAQEPPQDLRLEGVISGPTGVISGPATLHFTEEEQQTRLDYSAQAQVTGPLARVSPRLLEGVVEALLEIGIKDFNKELRAGLFAGRRQLPLEQDEKS